MEARPMARWWWPGGSVREETMVEQLALIQKAGFGGVEVQPLLLGLGEADLSADAKLRSVGQPTFYQNLASAAEIWVASSRVGARTRTRGPRRRSVTI